MDPILDNLILELKRGTQVFSALKLLDEPQYGYLLLQKLNDRNIDIEAGTLYPLLRRLESQKLLISDWDKSEPRARKYYQISKYGKEVLSKLEKEWLNITRDMNNIIKGDNNDWFNK